MTKAELKMKVDDCMCGLDGCTHEKAYLPVEVELPSEERTTYLWSQRTEETVFCPNCQNWVYDLGNHDCEVFQN